MAQRNGKQGVTKPHNAHQVLNAPDGDVAGNGNVAAIPVVFVKDIADAATANYDMVMTHKVEIVDVVVQKRSANGGAANTVTVQNSTNAISNALSININDTTLARATTIDDANSTIAAGGTLRIAVSKAGGNAACFVVVTAVRRA